MPTFTPSAISAVPPTLPDTDGVAERLFRYYKSRPEGVNVYIYKAGSPAATAFGRVSENDPITVYNSAGVAISTGWEDLELVAWGGHGPITVNSDQAAALVAAGYTVT